ncbi:MAG: beta strand repeat-containing protein [Spirulinaceae cyanobacterium]
MIVKPIICSAFVKTRSLFFCLGFMLLHQPAGSSQTLAEAGWEAETITPQIENTVPFLPRFGGQFTTGSGLDNRSSYGSVYGWFPFSTTATTDLGFTETRFSFDTENSNFSSNILIGYRQILPQDNGIFGTYLSYDLRNTGNYTFQQIGGGLEWLSSTWEMRLNAYLPIGNRRPLVATEFIPLQTSFSQPRFQNQFLVVNRRDIIQQNQLFEAALTGFDFEVGKSLFQGYGVDLWGYVGMYFYGGEGVESFGGVRSRLLAQYNHNFNASLTLQSDAKFGTNLIFSVGMSWGGYQEDRPEVSLLQQLAKPIIRQDRISIETQLESEVLDTTQPVFLTNPITKQPWRFFHVTPGGNNGNGTIEFPFNSIVTATNQTQGDRNEIIYVQIGTNPGLAGFTIPDFVQVLSTGPQQIIDTVELGQLQLAGSGNNIFPAINNTVNMGNNTVLSGFTITGQNNPGIVIQNVGNAEIRDNIISSSRITAIQLNNTTGLIQFRNNQITGNTVPALIADNVNNVTITESQINSINSIDNGMTLNRVRGNFDFKNTTFNIDRPTNYGIQVSQVTGSANLTATTGSQIRGAGLAGASLADNTTFSGFTIDATGNDGIVASNVRDLRINNNRIINSNNSINIQNNTGAIAIDNNQMTNVTNGIILQNVNAVVSIKSHQIEATNNGIAVQNLNDAIAINNNRISNVTNSISLQNINAAVSINSNQIEATNNGIALQNLNDAIAINNNRISNITNGIDIQTIAGTATIANNEITNIINNGVNVGILDNLATLTINDNQISQAGANGRGISIDEMQTNAQTTVDINNNRISNIGDEGIYFNDIQNNARANITVDSNIIEATGQEGIQIDFIDDTAIANITISDNTIRDTGANQEGIYFHDIQGNAQANITISGNTIERVGSRAIAFDLIEVNATPTIIIENNQIDTTGDQGIYFDDIENLVNGNIIISGNAIANTGEDSIQFNIIENDAVVSLQVINNTLTNSAQDGLEIQHTSDENLCLVLSGNTTTGITGNGFNLLSGGVGQFQIVDRANINTNNTGTFNPNNIAASPLFADGNLGTFPCP